MAAAILSPALRWRSPLTQGGHHDDWHADQSDDTDKTPALVAYQASQHERAGLVKAG